MIKYNIRIADFLVGDEIQGFFILKDGAVKTTAAGKSFLTGVISDCSGVMDAKFWDYRGPIGMEPSTIGEVYKIQGIVSEFKGSMQLTIGKIRPAVSTDNYRISDLVPSAPIDVDRTVGMIRAILDTLTDEDYRRVAETMLDRHIDRFKVIPAAKSVHHSFLNGLLMHTANMLRAADFFSGLYSGTVNRSLLITGTLLHDFGKEQEFSFSKFGLVTEYSTKGQLLGHLVMGAEETAEVCRELGISEEKTLLLQHLILSHHGEPEFGAAVLPQCAEAELLSLIDKVDSRMEVYAENLAGMKEGEFSDRIFALDHRIYKHD